MWFLFKQGNVHFRKINYRIQNRKISLSTNFSFTYSIAIRGGRPDMTLSVCLWIVTLSVCLWIVVLGASVGRDEYIKRMISTLK